MVTFLLSNSLSIDPPGLILRTGWPFFGGPTRLRIGRTDV